jgi:hypothetical protein
MHWIVGTAYEKLQLKKADAISHSPQCETASF